MAALEMGLKFQTTPGLPSTSRLVFYLGLLSQGLSCISPIAAARLEQLAPSPRLLAGCAPCASAGPVPCSKASGSCTCEFTMLGRASACAACLLDCVFFVCVCERF